jgi:hypothetical protein
MSSITNAAGLQNAVQQLEVQQAHELVLLKAAFNTTTESLQPINIIRSTLKNAMTAPDLKVDVIKAAIGLTTGVLAKKLMIGKTINPFKKLLGVLIEMTVANKVVKNADEIKSTGSMLLNTLFHKKEKKDTV